MPTLNWIGKDAVVNHHLEVPFRLLKDVPELACGEPLFDEHGNIRDTVTFADLARHVYFSETGEPLPRERVSARSPFLGAHHGTGIYLLYNGILSDKTANGGNVLTRAVIAKLPQFDGPKVIYCAGCLIGRERLQAERIVVRQTPYEIRVS